MLVLVQAQELELELELVWVQVQVQETARVLAWGAQGDAVLGSVWEETRMARLRRWSRLPTRHRNQPMRGKKLPGTGRARRY